jgi:DNA-binding CsgD family transcriptional regulator
VHGGVRMLGFLKTKKEKLKKDTLIATLTNKEVEVFKILVEGYTMKEASKLLNVKYSTINSHTKAIYKKLSVNSRSQLILKFHNLTNNMNSKEGEI